MIMYNLMKISLDYLCLCTVKLNTYIRNAGKFNKVHAQLIGLPSKWTCVEMQISGPLALEDLVEKPIRNKF